VFVECAVVMATEAVPAGNLLPVASHLCVWPETGLKQRAEAEQSGFEFSVCRALFDAPRRVTQTGIFH